MATKKQKRQAAAEKRLAFDEETRQLGLKAQQADREKREARAERARQEGERLNTRYERIIKAAFIAEALNDCH